MGFSHREQAGYSESHETMVTGAFGKKPHSQPQQGNQRRMTPLFTTKERLQIYKIKIQNNSRKELQKQGWFGMQLPKPEVIKTSSKSSEILKANHLTKKEGSYGPN